MVRLAAVLCICNVRPHAKTAGNLVSLFSFLTLKLGFNTFFPLAPHLFILRAPGESSADLSLIVEWEGFDALEPIENAATEESPGTVKTQTKPEEKPAQAEEFGEPEVEWKQRRQRPSPPELSESSDDGSGDEYVDEEDRRKDAAGSGHMRKVRHHAWPITRARRSHSTLSRKRANNRRIPTASSSDSEEDDAKEKAVTKGVHARRANVASVKAKTVSTSPPPGVLKRKQSISTTGTATAPSAAKRKRAESSSTTASTIEDAARKYCLGKFAEMFTGIFMQYPYIQQEGKAEEEDGGERKKAIAERKPEELTEEDKAQVRERATAFATEVEQAVFDTYAEPDKYGKMGAGVKYKYVSRLCAPNLLLRVMAPVSIVSIQGALSYTYLQFATVRPRRVAQADLLLASRTLDALDDVFYGARVPGTAAVDQTG